MKTAENVFNGLQAKYGEYGEYVLLEQPHYSNSPNSDEYLARTTTLDEIKEAQKDGWACAGGYPESSWCGYLCWDVIDVDCDDEEDACDWTQWCAYDSYSRYVTDHTKGLK